MKLSTCVTITTNFVIVVHNENFPNAKVRLYEGWNFNSGNYLFTTDTK